MNNVASQEDESSEVVSLELKHLNEIIMKALTTVLTTPQFADIMDKAVKKGTLEAINTFEKRKEEIKEETADRRLRNTKLLLRNYRMMKLHAKNAVFSRQELKENVTDIIEDMMQGRDDDVVIESIQRSAARTVIMIDHIDTMIDLYRTYCMQSSQADIEMRRYQVLYDMYIAEPGLSVQEIAEKQNMSKENAYSDLKVATERLTALFFGVDGLRMH